MHPVRVDVVMLDKADERANVHMTDLDHLGEDEALAPG